MTRSRTWPIALMGAALLGAGVLSTTAAAAAPLSASERATLLEMREEEKLAHDVYVALAEATGARVFTRIAAAETQHGKALERALGLYGIADPTDGFATGSFPSATFQALYDRLVAKGSASLAAALAVGVEIEALDVADLTAAIAGTDEATLDAVYASLRSGSTRHLAAFERQQAGGGGGGRWR